MNTILIRDLVEHKRMNIYAKKGQMQKIIKRAVALWGKKIIPKEIYAEIMLEGMMSIIMDEYKKAHPKRVTKSFPHKSD